MVIQELLKDVKADILIFLGTTLIAFIAWLIKGLIEKPLLESKNTFNKFLEKRIEILIEIKTRLSFISYFPDHETSKEFKEQLQQLLLKDGRAAYLNHTTYQSIIKIAIDPNTNEKLLLKTIQEINDDLYGQISKVEDEIKFYKNFSNFNPFKRFIGLTILSLQYVLALSFVVFILFFFFKGLWIFSLIGKIALMILAVIILYLSGRWLRR